MEITLKNISKTFDKHPALTDVSLTIHSGEFFFLLGPSGCGKTTLLRVIAGFCQPDSGDLFFDGVRATDLPPQERETAMVFQNYALWPHMTVAENIGFGLAAPQRKLDKTERRQRVEKVLKEMRLDGLADRLPAQLSGGQQQRVALARALAVAPKCLLLDEPLSNLDAKLRQEMRLELRRLIKKAGITAVYVTHDQQEALSMADRCALLRAGRIAQCGTPQELYLQPAACFVADFIGGANLLPATVKIAETPQKVVVTLGQGNDLRWEGRITDTSRPVAAGQAVTVAVRPEHFTIHHRPPPDGNCLAGVITESLYYGHALECFIEMESKHALRVVCPAGNNDSAAAFQTAKNIFCRVAPKDTMIIPEPLD